MGNHSTAELWSVVNLKSEKNMGNSRRLLVVYISVGILSPLLSPHF